MTIKAGKKILLGLSLILVLLSSCQQASLPRRSRVVDSLLERVEVKYSLVPFEVAGPDCGNQLINLMPSTVPFARIGAAGWRTTGQKFRTRMIQIATRKKYDSVGLVKCLDAISSGAAGSAAPQIPVAAYYTGQHQRNYLIIFCVWMNPQSAGAGAFSRFNGRVFDLQTFQVVCEMSSK